MGAAPRLTHDSVRAVPIRSATSVSGKGALVRRRAHVSDSTIGVAAGAPLSNQAPGPWLASTSRPRGRSGNTANASSRAGGRGGAAGDPGPDLRPSRRPNGRPSPRGAAVRIRHVSASRKRPAQGWTVTGGTKHKHALITLITSLRTAPRGEPSPNFFFRGVSCPVTACVAGEAPISPVGNQHHVFGVDVL